jgi:hypothetical protein
MVRLYACLGPGSALLVLDDENDALGAGAGAAAGQSLFAGRYVEPFGGDIAFVIKRIEMLGDGMTAGVAGALSLVDTYFHADIFHVTGCAAAPLTSFPDAFLGQ